MFEAGVPRVLSHISSEGELRGTGSDLDRVQLVFAWPVTNRGGRAGRAGIRVRLGIDTAVFGDLGQLVREPMDGGSVSGPIVDRGGLLTALPTGYTTINAGQTVTLSVNLQVLLKTLVEIQEDLSAGVGFNWWVVRLEAHDIERDQIMRMSDGGEAVHEVRDWVKFARGP